METKRCSTCGRDKPKDAFNRHRKTKDGLQPRCRDCFRTPSAREKARARERAREWYQSRTPDEREEIRLRQKAWREANRDRSNGYSRRWSERNPEKHRARWVKSKYKLTQEQYEELLRHNGICDSCGKLPAAHIDHCHKTGHYRGQLCRGCNQAAGMLGDDPVRATALAAYLVRAQGASA